MPLYEYQCKSCAHRFERIVKFSDPPLKTCPKCGQETVEQMISAPAVQFKGSGWYVTDYAGRKAASDPIKTESTPTTASSASASATDAPPAPAPAPSGGTSTSSASSGE